MLSGAHRRASRPVLVLLQLLVFVTYIFGPTAAFAVEPTDSPEATPTDSAAPEVSSEPSTEPTADPTQAPTTAPEPTQTPATAAPEPTAAPSEASPEPAAAPTIVSDKADYPPGGLVTLTGTNWQQGEQV